MLGEWIVASLCRQGAAGAGGGAEDKNEILRPYHNTVMGNNTNTEHNRKAEEALAVPWMPCSVLANSIFLGSLEQARNPEVIKSLDITHIVSIGR